MTSRRRVLGAALTTWVGAVVARLRRAHAAPAEIAPSGDLPVEGIDFEASGIEGWTQVVAGARPGSSP